MALNYMLELSEKVTPEQLADSLMKILRLEAAAIEHDGPGAWQLHYKANVLKVYVPDDLSKRLMESAFGVSPSIGVLIRVDRCDESFEADSVIRLALMILDQTPGDAVLLHSGEMPVMLRRNGELIANTRFRNWDDEPFPMETIKREFTAQPVPSL
jgi:hypothetical protein